MAKREGSSASGPRTRSKAAKERREAEEVENTQGLDKLPQELWEKILDHLDENDLFPLALSCRYFRQKQKELVARTRQSGPENGKPCLALKTDLKRKLKEGQPVSAEYLRFCSKEKDVRRKKDEVIRCLAAFHGHLPLLQKLQAGSETLPLQIVQSAGESSSSTISSFLFPLLTSSPLSPFHSARRPAGDLEVAENPEGVQARLGAFRHSLQRRPFRDFEVAQE